MNKKKGYILLWRSLQDLWLWNIDEPYDSRSAWIDLLMMANHEDKKVPYGKGFVIVKRGQKLTSQRKLAEKWHWTRNRVKRYLNTLQNDGMIYADTTRGDTTITIVNYDSFQVSPTTNEATTRATGEAEGRATYGAQTIHYRKHYRNNEENIKKEEPSFSAPRDGGEWQ